MGGGGRGCAAIGTHPTAAARANGNHAAATDAIGSGDLKRDAAASYGGTLMRFVYFCSRKIFFELFTQRERGGNEFASLVCLS